MELDGKKLEATLSTDNSVTTLSTDVTKRVYGFDKESPGIESVTDASGKTTAQYRAMTLTAAALLVTDEKVRLIDPPANSCRLSRKNDAIGYSGCLYRYPLKLGSDVLAKLHVYRNQGEPALLHGCRSDRSAIVGVPSDPLHPAALTHCYAVDAQSRHQRNRAVVGRR
jgi:hypothetical protein